MRLPALVLLIAPLLMAHAAQADVPPPGAKPATPPPEPAAARLWQTHCANCHGATGRADTVLGGRLKLADLTRPAWKSGPGHETATLRRVIAEGTPGTAMRGYGARLSPSEIDALVTYVRAL